MSKITLNAAPSLSTVVYYIDVAGTALSAATAHTDAAEIVIGGVHTGTYQAAEPSAYLGILWTDGTAWEYVPNGAADMVAAWKADPWEIEAHAYTNGKYHFDPATKVLTLYADDGTTVVQTETLTIVNGTTTDRQPN